MDPYTVQYMSIDDVKTETGKPKKQQSKKKQKRNKPKQKPQTSDNIAEWTNKLWSNYSSLCAEKIRPCVKQPQTQHITLQAPGEDAKNNTSRCGNPGSPQPGSRRSQREAHELQNTIELRTTASEIAAPKPDLDARAKKRRFYEVQLQKTIVLPMQPQHEGTLTQPFTFTFFPNA